MHTELCFLHIVLFDQAIPFFLLLAEQNLCKIYFSPV